MKILFISLGCDKNLVDSEEMLGILRAQGYEFTDDETEADVIIVNTCCFINDAKDESIQTILEMAEYKKSGSCRALLVTGCMAQRYRQEILDELPEVDAVLGTTAWENIAGAIEKALAGDRSMEMEPLDRLPALQAPSGNRVVTTGGHFAYLKIAEGCDKHCTYCIIPKLRGPYRSVPMEQLLSQAEALAAQGVKELILVAQETTVYGVDLYGHKCLHLLIEALCKISGLRWIRILYCYPEEIYDELIEVMRREPKVCHYLDLPIQHASDAVLKRMGRRTTRADLTAIIENLRENIPDIVLRTTLIAGFPGETQQQHEELMDFVDEMEFDRLGVFPYSQEEDTPAALMPDQLDEETKQIWQEELMELQQEIAFDRAEQMIGRTVTAMVEGELMEEEELQRTDAEQPGAEQTEAGQSDTEEPDTERPDGDLTYPRAAYAHTYVARTYGDAPNVDGLLFINTDESLMTGDFAQVKITGAQEYDLIGVIADEFTE
ncbi:MAG: 30S ribosomal protein S12 methylthiotransferase RimO [Lachnospiraceae bacterium]|nr:30S ribosomal protein S12 methylthiotransferase RimO [Lachnospiraceae bacterium]